MENSEKLLDMLGRAETCGRVIGYDNGFYQGYRVGKRQGVIGGILIGVGGLCLMASMSIKHDRKKEKEQEVED